MKKRILVTPGPTRTPPWLRRKIEEYALHHRDEEYPQIIGEVKRDMQTLFGAPHGKVIIARGGGTAMMEAAITNFLKPEDPVLVVNVGFFGNRWTEMAEKVFKLKVFSCESEWGYSYDYSALIEKLEKHPIKLVLIQVTDTSTGVKNSLLNLARIVRVYSPEALIVADAVLEAGVSDIKMERWGIDVLLGASQKAFMLPPGMGFAILGERALNWLKNVPDEFPSYTLNFRLIFEKEDGGGILTTPPTDHIAGLHVVLNHILREKGESAWYDGHRLRAEFVRERLGKIGFKLYTKGTPSNGLSILIPPAGLEPSELVKKLADRGFKIELGLGKNKNSVIRIAHFAGVEEPYVLKLVETIEELVSTSS